MAGSSDFCLSMSPVRHPLPLLSARGVYWKNRHNYRCPREGCSARWTSSGHNMRSPAARRFSRYRRSGFSRPEWSFLVKCTSESTVSMRQVLIEGTRRHWNGFRAQHRELSTEAAFFAMCSQIPLTVDSHLPAKHAHSSMDRHQTPNQYFKLFVALAAASALLFPQTLIPSPAQASGVEKLAIKGGKVLDKVLTAAAGPMITADTVSAMLEVEEDEPGGLLSVAQDFFFGIGDWFGNWELIPEGETLFSAVSLAFQGFFERLAAIELSAVAAQGWRWLIISPVVAGAMWWQMQGKGLFGDFLQARREGQDSGAGGSGSRVFRPRSGSTPGRASRPPRPGWQDGERDKEEQEEETGRAKRVRGELLRLGLQAQLAELVALGTPVRLQKSAPSGEYSTVSEREQSVERIMRQLVELGPREELLSLPLLSSGRGVFLLEEAGPAGGPGPLLRRERVLPRATAALALEGDWELVYISSSGAQSAAQAVNGAPALGLPERMLQYLLDVTGSVPPVTLEGPVLQTVKIVKRSFSRQQAQGDGGLFSDETSAVDSQAGAAAPRNRPKALQTLNSATVRLGPVGVVRVTLNVGWGLWGSEAVRQEVGVVPEDASESERGQGRKALPRRSEVSVEGVSVEPVEVLGRRFQRESLPLFAPFPPSVQVPEALRPINGGHMAVQYIDDKFRIDSDDAGLLFLFKRIEL